MHRTFNSELTLPLPLDILPDTSHPSARGRHGGPVADFGLIRIVVRVIGAAVAAEAVGPMELLLVGELGGAVVGIVERIHAADVVVEFIGGAAAAARRRIGAGLGQLTVDTGEHGGVVGAELLAECRRGGSPCIAS